MFRRALMQHWGRPFSKLGRGMPPHSIEILQEYLCLLNFMNPSLNLSVTEIFFTKIPDSQSALEVDHQPCEPRLRSVCEQGSALPDTLYTTA